MSNDVISSELFKFIVTSLNNLLKLLDFVVEKVGALPTAFLVATTALNKKFHIFNDKDILSRFGNLLKSIKKKAQETQIQVEVETVEVENQENNNPEIDNSTITSGLASFGKALAIAAIIAVVMKAIQAIAEAWFMEIKKAEEKVSELSEQYNNVKDELDSINSKLEENQQKINEINANGLDFAGEELEKLQKQNEELRLQKQYLEDIESIKKEQLNNATQDLLDLNTYSSFNEKDTKVSVAWEQLRNGQYEKALGTLVGLKYNEKDNILVKGLKNVLNVLNFGLDDIIYGAVFKTEKNITAQEYAQEQIDELNKLLDEKNKILNSSESLNYITYIETNKQISEMNESLTETMAYLTEQQKTLDENSKLYKQINDLIEQYSEINKNIKLNASGFIDLSIDTYFDGENFDEKVFKKVQKKFITGKNKTNLNYTGNSYYGKNASQSVLDVYKNNNIKTIDNGTNETIRAKSYQDILNAINDINTLKEKGLFEDTEANRILEQRLYTMAGITDEERDYVELVSKLNTYSFINGFLNNNDLGISNLSEISANTYTTFKNALVEKAQSEGQDTALIESVLANLFPDYQTVEGRMKEYISQNSSSAIARAIDEYNKTGVASVTVTGALSAEFEALGASAENANSYVRDLAQGITEEKIAALDSATNQAEQDFVTNQTDYNDNFSKVKDAYMTAISAITDGSSISYDDMWTLINADTELATKFTKSVNGYKISVDDLTESQNKYVQNTKHTYLTEVENARKRIEDLKQKKEQITAKLNNSTDAIDRKTYLEQIDDVNKKIEENTILIAENQLMYEQASDSMFKYGEQLEKAVSKLSTFKSLYSGILNDMASIGRIGAENLVQIMQTFPEDWQTLITKSTSGKGFKINKQAYKDRVVRELGFSGGDKETISQDMFNNLETELDSLAKQYGITYDKGVSFEEQLEKVKKTAAVNGQSGFKDFSDRLNKINEGFENIDESASVVAEVIRTLFEIFKEDKALTNFNNVIDDLDYKLSTGQINQAQHDAGVRQANEDYKKAVKDPDDPNTKKQLQQNEIDIYTADQNRYQKELDKKTQDLQDAYDHRLISAKEYYRELNKLEDEYYGKNNDYTSPDDLKKLRDFEKKMQSEYGLGNVDLTKRPKVNSETMRKSGYDVEDGGTSTVYTSFEFVRQGDEENGKYVALYYTPILPDGSVLDEKTLHDYIYGTLAGSQDILNADAENLGIVLNVKTDLNISDEDMKSLETGNYTQNIQNIIKTCDEWGVSLHNVQEDWVDLVNTTRQKTNEIYNGLLNDPDGTNVANKNRQQLERRVTLVNDEIEKIKRDYSRGLMTFEQFEYALGDSLDYWLGNIEELKDTYNELERENISALYEEEIKLSDQALERGEKTNYQYAQDMINIWKKYYKDKDRYRQEDLASERQAVEASKQAVQSQIDAFQHLIDKNNDDAEGQINELQDQKDKIEHKYDKQIKTLQKQKDLISDAVDKEDRRLKLLEAQKELQKTKQNSRQVYGSDGSITYKPDTEKSKEAQKSYNDAITSEILNLMQDDIDVLEKQKEKETEPINNKILEIEQKRDEANKFLKAIVDMLGTILEDTYDINAEYVKRLLESDDAKAELDKINKEREQAGEDPISWSDISSLIETSKEEIDKETSQEEQENFLLNTPSETKDDRKGNGNSTDSTKASGTYIDKSINKDNAKNEDSKTTDNSENDKVTDKNNIESTNNVFDINDYYFSKLEKLLGTPIPVTITDNIKKNIDNANQRVQSDIEQINTNNNTGNSLTFTGDIVINNPVGNSDDLAKELMLNLPNAFQNQIYTNLQR